MKEKKQTEADQEIKTQKASPETVTISQTEYDELTSQAGEFKDKYYRLLADFENSRKRQERERGEFVKYANEGLLKDVLDVVDDLERLVIAAHEKHKDYESFLKGVEMVMGRVSELLKKQGVEVMDARGKPFDPYAHEILMQEPSGEHEAGTVIQEFQKGYRFGDRVLRTAKVKVAAESASDQQPEDKKQDEDRKEQG
ncbi:MAG: nucleotide exchange factor GrpE [Candidatus Omnitrophota bacterium]